MKPKPLVALNHLTVPVAILLLQDAQMRAVPARPSRGLDPISAMSWGVEPVRRDQQGKSIIRMGGVYALTPEIASNNPIRATCRRYIGTVQSDCRPDQYSRLICSSVTTRSTFSVLLL